MNIGNNEIYYKYYILIRFYTRNKYNKFENLCDIQHLVYVIKYNFKILCIHAVCVTHTHTLSILYISYIYIMLRVQMK